MTENKSESTKEFEILTSVIPSELSIRELMNWLSASSSISASLCANLLFLIEPDQKEREKKIKQWSDVMYLEIIRDLESRKPE